MQITQEADYAMRIVRFLARLEPDLRAEARIVSADQGIPLRFALKILHKLTGAGIARSYRGVKGGYALARTASDITMLDVIESIDGRMSINKCLADSSRCSIAASDACAIHCNLVRIQRMMCDEMKKVTFADIVEQEAACPVHAPVHADASEKEEAK